MEIRSNRRSKRVRKGFLEDGAAEGGLADAAAPDENDFRLFRLHRREVVTKNGKIHSFVSPPKMPELPPEVLLRIIQHSLTPSATLPFLTQFGRGFSNLTLAASLATLALEDDDAVLLAAEQASSNTQLSAIYRFDQLPNFVHALALTPAAAAVPPLEDTSFLFLLAKLPSLTRFTWSSARLPPNTLCRALAQTAKSLTRFTLDLTTEATAKLRWDAKGISALPGGLLDLSISNLSSAGATNLAAAFTASSFPELDRLTLQRTAFVDDTLLQAVAEGSMKLTRLRIIDMSGTKLTGEGLRAVFENDEIKELVLGNVQGQSLALTASIRSLFFVVEGDSPGRAGKNCRRSRRPSRGSRSRTRKKERTTPGSPIISIPSATSFPAPPSAPSRSLANKDWSEIRRQHRER